MGPYVTSITYECWCYFDCLVLTIVQDFVRLYDASKKVASDCRTLIDHFCVHILDNLRHVEIDIMKPEIDDWKESLEPRERDVRALIQDCKAYLSRMEDATDNNERTYESCRAALIGVYDASPLDQLERGRSRRRNILERMSRLLHRSQSRARTQPQVNEDVDVVEVIEAFLGGLHLFCDFYTQIKKDVTNMQILLNEGEILHETEIEHYNRWAVEMSRIFESYHTA
ncbi:unnamed protein product [Somion occarium]|uniref:Uncharacterized protein n=1 Tax=Somion occarium TaxID=3059160 RepID=A0ABP1E6D1_9APHY